MFADGSVTGMVVVGFLLPWGSNSGSHGLGTILPISFKTVTLTNIMLGYRVHLGTAM